jgi:S1-C subfamily serine protease
MRIHTLLIVAVMSVPSLAVAQSRAIPMDDDWGTRQVRSTSISGTTTEPDARALLGLVLASSGTDRDTLGLLVTAVTKSSPAERAGIDEGNRLAEINGIDLRVQPSDVGDRNASDAPQRALAKALRSVRPGDDVSLRLFGGGRMRSVNLQAAGAAPPVLPKISLGMGTDRTAPPASLADVVQTIATVQAQLRRIAQNDAPDALAETLAWADRDLNELQRRLRDAQTAIQKRSEDRSGGEQSGTAEIRGLRVSAVSDDLAAYFGEGARTGLLVVETDGSWSPLRAGDIILTVNGAAVDRSQLAKLAESRPRTRIQVLRRWRQLTLTLNERG